MDPYLFSLLLVQVMGNLKKDLIPEKILKLSAFKKSPSTSGMEGSDLVCYSVVHGSEGLCSLAGRGSRKGAAQVCMSCHGTGMQVRVHQLLPGMVQQVSTVCSSCQGQGQRISHKDRCKACGGRKILRQKKILEVHIDKGERKRRRPTSCSGMCRNDHIF